MAEKRKGVKNCDVRVWWAGRGSMRRGMKVMKVKGRCECGLVVRTKGWGGGGCVQVLKKMMVVVMRKMSVVVQWCWSMVDDDLAILLY